MQWIPFFWVSTQNVIFLLFYIAYIPFSRNPFKQKKLIINDFISVIAEQAQLQRLSSKTGDQT
jgi:hypothetical protein